MSIIGICASILVLAAGILVWHEQYEDGLFGRIALGGVFIAGLVVVLSELFADIHYSAPLELNLMAVSITLFMSRHVYRFLRYIRTGIGAWKSNTGISDVRQ